MEHGARAMAAFPPPGGDQRSRFPRRKDANVSTPSRRRTALEPASHAARTDRPGANVLVARRFCVRRCSHDFHRIPGASNIGRLGGRRDPSARASRSRRPTWRSSSSRSRSPSATPRPLTPANPCGTLVGTGPEPDPRPAQRRTACAPSTARATTCFPGRETFAAADQPFPRLTTPVVPRRGADHAGLPGRALGTDVSYAQKTGNVVDSQPRVISNLIVDQTSTNPAAVAAAGFPVRTQGNAGVVPCTTDPDPTATPTDRRRPGRLRAGAPDAVHPERHDRRRPVAAVQLAVHVLRPVLRPRRRPDRQGRRHGVRAAARPTTR